MKKVLALVLVVVSLLSQFALADIDLSGMSLAELQELQKQVVAAMWATDEWEEVKVPAGVYKIGEDIPAGRWTIRPIDGETAGIIVTDKINEGESEAARDHNYYDYEQITSPNASYYKYNKVEFITWKLNEGMYIIIDNSSVIFTHPTGASLGFK